MRAFVEPAGIVGSASERTQKMQLLSQTDDPAFVFVGNSRVQRWNPDVVSRETGTRGFNASIVGSPLTDARAIVEWLAARARKQGAEMPHVVVSTPPEIFTEQPPAPNDLGLPHVAGSSTRRERLLSRMQRAARLTQWQSTQQAFRVFVPRTTVRTEPALTKAAPAPSQSLEDAQSTRPTQHVNPSASSTETRPAPAADRNMSFQANGYLEAGAFFGSSSFGGTRSLERLVEGQYRQFYDSIKRRGGPERIDPSAQRELERLLRSANQAGDTPALVMPPMRLDLARELAKLDRPSYQRALDAWLDDLHNRYSFTMLDYDNFHTFPVSDDMFYDGVHPHKDLADTMVRRMIDDDPGLKLGR